MTYCKYWGVNDSNPFKVSQTSKDSQHLVTVSWGCCALQMWLVRRYIYIRCLFHVISVAKIAFGVAQTEVECWSRWSLGGLRIPEDPRSNPKLKAVLDKINDKIGWKKIKEAVKDLVTVCGTNYQRELDGQAPLSVFLNRLFLGNPGTGGVRNEFLDSCSRSVEEGMHVEIRTTWGLMLLL